jgi:hypothetical protein
MWLTDDSKWYCHPTTTPIPKEWETGDKVIVGQAGLARKGEDKIAHKITNNDKKKQNVLGYWDSVPEKDTKNVDKSNIIEKRKGVIDDNPNEYRSSGEKFNKFDEELVIKAASEEFIWLHGGWKWRWQSLTPGHGPWKANDRVIISKVNERRDAEVYKMTNVKTGKYLMVVPAKEEE